MNRVYKINFPEVISEPMEFEQVVIDLKSGCYYNLNESASYIWRMIELGNTIKEITSEISKISHQLDDDIVALIEDFINKLEEEQLIVLSEFNENRDLKDMPTSNFDFTLPAFQKFEDMREMLLLDPIHEVSEAGWPNLPEKDA